jgi:hypothetical protein
VPKADLPNEDGTVAKRTEKQRLAMEQEAMDEEQRNDKYRPQNLNDYIHLLPSSLQYEAREVKKKYYAPLREARARMESLAENPDATEQQRSEAAARLAAADDALADFWERVDLAYKKVMGVELPEDSSKEKKLSEFTKADIEAIEDESMREKMKVARIDNDKKYLRRSDLPEDEDTKEQLLLRATELKEWGVKITARQLANMQRFGVEFSME